jgi:hypothetical protein
MRRRARAVFLALAALFAVLTLPGLAAPARPAAEVLTPFALLIEAESGEITAPMAIGQDATASACLYVSSAIGYQGTAALRFTVETAGEYAIWGRAVALASPGGPPWTHDTFFYALDSPATVSSPIWEIAQDGWGWRRILNGPEVSFALAPGQHSISFLQRDGEGRLDAVFITSDPEYVPDAVAPCSELPTATATATATPTATASATRTVTATPTVPAGPLPDLRPTTLEGYPYPVAPSSVMGTHEVNALYAGQPTYFDWYVTNASDVPVAGVFQVELRIDGVTYIRFPFADWGPGWSGGFDDWGLAVPTAGWHMVSLVTDADSAIAESDEGNNVWAMAFYWLAPGETPGPSPTATPSSVATATATRTTPPGTPPRRLFLPVIWRGL